ncbi:cytochrome b-c1 complex subunit 7 [Fimicolochytrium jonesii]|uniref:cytochrome b-c1 complex subunit 7 n=1 Tax=Fimicolochytrium jonesii TaxID=1396493 RepID=UPI0022FE736B|nr:cytochrome b-c1 complex subunit 7 [Fimicolochytrium jonesii]XP_052923413.1 cytochrome b-c1 complex subunit 7 [Fimicolochytrium jonesii]KAI8816470.1 cytochrome b-c1 complex subunit 7 [Fimicolochytrium jonesii]KAI8818445.1 cytochrome b-c1 complex subunit 7 [Fimicolochytrium jonesii]
MAQALLQSLRSLRSTEVVKNLSEWHHNLMGYRKMGLRYDDLIPEENDLVQTALSRLPPKEHYDRIFRHRRAINLSAQHAQLEANEWTTAAQDVPYLTPLIKQVENEIATKEYFDTLTTIPAALKKRNHSTA